MIVSDEREVARAYDSEKLSFGHAPDALLSGFAGLPDCEVHVVSCLQHPVRSAPRLADNIFIHSVTVPKLGWLRTAYIGCITAIRRELKEIQPDIVHGQGTERYCALGAAYSGFRNVVTIHGNMRRLARLARARTFTFAWCTARLEGFAIPRTDGFVCPSAHTQRQVQPRARQTWVIPNAADSNFFDVRRVPPSTPTFLCVANILPLKNQIGLIEALDLLAPRHRFRLLFVGSAFPGSDYAEKFRRLVDQRPWCEYGGVANRNQLKQLLGSATALILPSLEENCPMAILEAMAAGVPVLASSVGGIPEVVKDGETGFLFDPAAPKNVSEAVIQVLREPALAAAMGQQGKVYARHHFHPREVATAHLALYRELRAAAKGSSF
jgi:glycosyltransferase involved in cell wall biosynthesis